MELSLAHKKICNICHQTWNSFVNVWSQSRDLIPSLHRLQIPPVPQNVCLPSRDGVHLRKMEVQPQGKQSLDIFSWKLTKSCLLTTSIPHKIIWKMYQICGTLNCNQPLSNATVHYTTSMFSLLYSAGSLNYPVRMCMQRFLWKECISLLILMLVEEMHPEANTSK